MKKAILGVFLLLGLAAWIEAGGRANFVTHVDHRKGEVKEILSSAGNCRHHLSAHPEDTVMTVNGPSSNPDDCN